LHLMQPSSSNAAAHFLSATICSRS
jgi:hypothetical protein